MRVGIPTLTNTYQQGLFVSVVQDVYSDGRNGWVVHKGASYAQAMNEFSTEVLPGERVCTTNIPTVYEEEEYYIYKRSTYSKCC